MIRRNAALCVGGCDWIGWLDISLDNNPHEVRLSDNIVSYKTWFYVVASVNVGAAFGKSFSMNSASIRPGSAKAFRMLYGVAIQLFTLIASYM